MQGTDDSRYRVRTNPVRKEPDSAYLQSVVPTGHPDSVCLPWRGVVTKDGYKYVCLENTPWLMFDLNENPYEQMNLALNTAYRKKLRELNDLLRDWIERTGDSFPLPEIR